MSILILSPDEQNRFEQFLRHRQLNERAIELLSKAKRENDIKRDLQAAKNLSYSQIVENLTKAVNNGWLDLDELVDTLDKSELAGKQHVCVFQLPQRGKNAILDELRNPKGPIGGPPTVQDFFTLPTDSSIRIIRDTPNEVITKIVARRSYWITNILETNPERQLLEKLLHRERSALVLKCNKSTGFLQIRVPPREKGPSETSKAVYKFAVEALGAHYSVGPKTWFYKIEYFPIQDAYPKVIKNETDFELWYDTPEDSGTKTRISKKGRPKQGSDLRKEKTWQYADGFARTGLRGFWECASYWLYVHMNPDTVRIDQNTTRDVGRLFIPSLCTDQDIDHVIRRIHEHF